MFLIKFRCVLDEMGEFPHKWWANLASAGMKKKQNLIISKSGIKMDIKIYWKLPQEMCCS